MEKKIIFSIILCIFGFLDGMETSLEKKSELIFPEINESWGKKNYNATCKEAQFFKTEFLANSQEVEKILINEFSFKKDTFMSNDNIRLECLIRTVENPSFTFIISAGFLPGKMTGMATLIAMLPENCNIIFYNNRGKGNSQGRLLSSFLWTSLRHYGAYEYNDVIGALNYAKKIQSRETKEKTPLFMYGICAGAFHTIKALCKLHQQEKISDYNIKGLILDSSVTSVQKDLENIPEYLYPYPKTGSVCTALKRAFLWFLRYTFFRRCFMTAEEKTTLNPELLAQTKIPTLHFNCKTGDPLTTYETTNAFYEKQKNKMPELLKKTCTNKCFERSKHALHHLINKKDYAAMLAVFIKTYIQ